jgi:hypothetical protein
VSRIITAVAKFAVIRCVSGDAMASRRLTVITTILIAAGAVLVAVLGSALIAPQGDIKP